MEQQIESLSNELVEKESEEQLLKHAILHLNGSILGAVLGIVLGLIIFAATNWLVIRGGPEAGTHLRLLNQFFYGYSVTFVGSLIGLVWGFAVGFIIGFLVAWIYNQIVILKGHN